MTDAPTDNRGRGESFSPTDLVVTALATCQITTIGIAVQNENINLDGTKIYAEKHMSTDPPRRIVKIVLRLDFPAGIPKDQQGRIERIAHTCPVAKSIHPDIYIDLTFNYAD